MLMLKNAASACVRTRRRAAARAFSTSQDDGLKQRQVEHLWHPMTNQKSWTDGTQSPPSPVKSAVGSTLTRADGTTLLDGVGGLWCVNVGYGRQELADVARDALMELSYLTPTMGNPAQIDLATKLAGLLELEGGTHTYFTSSGSEANETAMKIARAFHASKGEPQRHKIISRYRGYHGNTLGAMAATGQADRKTGFGTMPAGFLHVMPPYPYRRHPKFSTDEHCAELARQLDETIKLEGAETVAAFIAEPVISGGGVLVPNATYHSDVQRVLKKHGVLYIQDEVVSGFGRTGKMFGHEHYDCKPDIVTLAKGLTSGYMPLAACCVNDEIFRGFFKSNDLPSRLAHLRQINTYGGHPAACAVALANIEIIEAEKLGERAEETGAYLMRTLREQIGDHPFVGEVRGKGLLVGVELVQCRESKEPLEESLAASVVTGCNKNHGVIVGRNASTVPGLANVLILAPPLIITTGECDTVVAALKAELNGIR